MGYTKTDWVNGVTSANATNMNKIEDELVNLQTNKVLWQDPTGVYMNADQTANLSENVSEQKNGIVLVFSAYTPGTEQAQNWNWSCHFIPKKIVELQTGGGHAFSIADTTGTGVRACKYIYIHNNRLVGSSDNVGTQGELNNSLAVLRYVIGV